MLQNRTLVPGPSTRGSGFPKSGVPPLEQGRGDPHLASEQSQVRPLSSLLEAIIPFAIGAVALVLLLGLLNMMRGGSPSRSQTLMRARVLLQFLTIIVVMTALWLMAG